MKYLFIALICFLAGVGIMKSCEKEDLHPKEIEVLKNEIALLHLKENGLHKAIAESDLQIRKSDSVAIQRKQETAKVSKERDYYRSQLGKAKDCPDSVKAFVKIERVDSSLIASQDKQIKQDSLSILARDKRIAATDSLNLDLTIEIGKVKQLDELHVNLLKESQKEGREKFWRGMEIGGIIGALLILIL